LTTTPNRRTLAPIRAGLPAAIAKTSAAGANLSASVRRNK